MGIGSQFLGVNFGLDDPAYGEAVGFGTDWSDRVYEMQVNDAEFGEDFAQEMINAIDSGDPYAIGQNVGGLGTIPGMSDIEDDVIAGERDQHRKHHGQHHKKHPHHPHHGGHPGARPAGVHGEGYPHRLPLVGSPMVRAGDMGCSAPASGIKG